LFRHAIALSAERRVPLAFHLAESREEMELLRTGGGPFRTFLESVDAWDPAVLRPGTRPLDYLRPLVEADRTLVIHGNYLDDAEFSLLAAHRERMAVVYCPRTHRHFGHAPYALEKMLSAGVSVALGTDSRASSPDLSVLAEMRTIRHLHPTIPTATILRLGTLAGALALGRSDLGVLAPGRSATLTIISLPDRTFPDPHDLLFAASCPVTRTYHRGHVHNS